LDLFHKIFLFIFQAVAKCISQNRDILTTAEWEDLKRSHGDLTHRLLESVIFGQAKWLVLISLKFDLKSLVHFLSF